MSNKEPKCDFRIRLTSCGINSLVGIYAYRRVTAVTEQLLQGESDYQYYRKTEDGTEFALFLTQIPFSPSPVWVIAQLGDKPIHYYYANPTKNKSIPPREGWMEGIYFPNSIFVFFDLSIVFFFFFFLGQKKKKKWLELVQHQ